MFKDIFDDNKIDIYYLINVLIIIIVGVIMVYDASVIYSNEKFDLKYHFVTYQIVWLILGIVGGYAVYKLRLSFIRSISKYIYIGTLILLIFVLLPTPFAPEVYGARRWFILNPEPLPLIPLIGRIGFQPSELAKLASITYLSSALLSEKYRIASSLSRLKIFLYISLPPVLLILFEPDFTTAFVLMTILLGIYFFSGASIYQFLVGAPLLFIISSMYAISSAYRRQRVMTLFNPENIDHQGAGYHIRQIMIALGSGGFWGLGFGRSRQKYAYLPEVQTDSIFAIIGEEFGFIGTTLLILVLLSLFLRGIHIVINNVNIYASYVSTGIIIWIIIQTLINLGAMVRIIPLTGVPLPFISYGGSSLVFMLMGVGLVLNSSRYVKE